MKKCQAEGCSYNVFSHGYCKKHQYMRTDKRAVKSSDRLVRRLSFKSGYKIPPRKKVANTGVIDSIIQFGFKSQVELFKYVWERDKGVDGKRRCWLTGRALDYQEGSSLWLSCMAHVLRKSTYTYWRLNPYNIKLLSPSVHGMVDNFKEEYRLTTDIDFDKWFDLQEKYKKEYEEFKEKFLL